jgi:hypothetical protein
MLALNLLDELVDVGFLGHVALEGNNRSGNVFSMYFLNSLELLEGAANDVDLDCVGWGLTSNEGSAYGCSVHCEGLGDHEANAAAASSDDCNFVLVIYLVNRPY